MDRGAGVPLDPSLSVNKGRDKSDGGLGKRAEGEVDR